MNTATERDIPEVSEELLATVEAMNWSERRSLVASLADRIMDGDLREEIVHLIQLLADDPKWEVRKEVANLVPYLTDKRFHDVIEKLRHDSNSFVRKTAEQGRDRQQAVGIERQRRQRDLEEVAVMFARMEKRHGTAATQMARRIGDRLYDLLVGSTVHNMRSMVASLKADAQRLERLMSAGHIHEADMRKLMLRVMEGMRLFERLLDDMRDYSRPVPDKRRRERLIDLVQEACQTAQDRFTEKGHNMNRVSVEISVPESITLDASRHQLIVALTNLLDNSFDAFVPIRHENRHNRIQITGQLNQLGEIELTVADNGMGFGEEELEQIRQFLPGEITLKTDGTGFGLPTAKRYVAAHGGTLHIESEPGTGTTVMITLPRECREEVAA